MKSLATGTISGCFVWVFAFLVLAPILWLIVYPLSAFMTFTNPSYKMMQPILCPLGTTLDVKTFDTTTTDSNHHSIAATGHDMNCLDSNGEVVKKDLVVEYLLLWRLVGHVSGGIIAALLAFFLAASAGALIARFLQGSGKKNPT